MRSRHRAFVFVLLASGVAARGAAPGEVVGFGREVRDGAVHLIVQCSSAVSLGRSSGDPFHLRLHLAGVSRGALPAPSDAWARDVAGVTLEAAADGSATILELRLHEPIPHRVFVQDRELRIVLAATPEALTEPSASPTPEPAPASPRPPSTPTPAPEPDPPEPVDAGPPAPRATRVFAARRADGSSLTIHVPTDGVAEYATFFTEEPPHRLVIDVSGVESRPLFSRLDVNVGPVRAVRIAQHAAGPPPVVRIVFDLDERVGHRIAADPTGLTLTFDGID